MNRYLDASAHAKAYVQEEGSDDVRRWLRSGSAWASRLGFVEVHSALIRRARNGHFTRRELAAALAGVATDSRLVPILELDEEVGDRACRLLRSHSLRGADAIHLATALCLQDRLGAVTLATWDDRMLRAASTLRLPTSGGA